MDSEFFDSNNIKFGKSNEKLKHFGGVYGIMNLLRVNFSVIIILN